MFFKKASQKPLDPNTTLAAVECFRQKHISVLKRLENVDSGKMKTEHLRLFR